MVRIRRERDGLTIICGCRVYERRASSGLAQRAAFRDRSLRERSLTVTTLIADLFRPEAATAEAPPTLADDVLTADESAYIAGAVPARRAEFATARRLARAALGAIGVPQAACISLVPRADRAPTWPAGVVGSISHTREYCAVVVDRANAVRAIGLDAEALRPLEPALAAHIVTPREQQWIAAQPADEHDRWLLVCFSAKEAYYKAQYTITRRFLDFHDVELELSPASSRFEARLRDGSGPPELARLPGRFVVRAGMVLSAAMLVG